MIYTQDIKAGHKQEGKIVFSGMEHKTGTNRHQLQFMSLEDRLSADNPVRVIDAFVESLDLQEIGFAHTQTKAEGCPPYKPAVLLKLYLDGYNGGARIRSSRKLEAECHRNLELMWLTEEMKPSHTTISTFRKQHHKELKEVFKKLGLFLKTEGLIAAKEVCTDGTKIKGVNSKANNYTAKDVESYLAWLDKKTEEYLRQLDEADKEEAKNSSPLSVDKSAVKEMRRRLKEKKEKYNKLKEQMQEQQATQVSTTDAGTRLMQGADGSSTVGYNIQCSNDTAHSLIAGFTVSNEGDRHALHSTSVAVKETLGVEKLTVIADKGYHSGTELAACEKDGIHTLVAPQRYAVPKAVPDEGYNADRFSYNKAQDCYLCPEGQPLVTNGTWLKRKKKVGRQEVEARYKEYKSPHCVSCPVKHLCTRAAQGRVLTRFEYQQAIDANNKRVMENKESYQKRKCVSEHPFGTIKRAWGYTHALLKGIQKVTGEFALIFTCYNLRRAISILGVAAFINKLKESQLQAMA